MEVHGDLRIAGHKTLEEVRPFLAEVLRAAAGRRCVAETERAIVAASVVLRLLVAVIREAKFHRMPPRNACEIIEEIVVAIVVAVRAEAKHPRVVCEGKVRDADNRGGQREGDRAAHIR